MPDSSKLDENSNEIKPLPPSPIIDEARTNISSSIGPVISTPSPRFQKPVSLTSTKAYFHTIQQHGSSPILQLKTIVHNDDDEVKESIPNRPRTSSIKHGEKKDTIATVRFTNDSHNEIIEETYL